MLTILIGPNGSGKSTVLDALSIGAHENPAVAVGESVLRRMSRQSTARWLIHAQANSALVEVPIPGTSRATQLAWAPPSSIEVSAKRRSPIEKTFGIGSVQFQESDNFKPTWKVDANHVVHLNSHPLKFVDMRFGARGAADPVDVLTAAKTEGRAALARDIVREVIPSLENLEIMKVGDGFDIGLIYPHTAVPLTVSGDGIRGLTVLSLELAAQRDGTVLIEEPEVHQHLKSLQLSAQAIVAAVKREIQVVLTTHSLEFIDALLETSETAGLLNVVGIQRTKLTDGLLEVKGIPGEQAKRIRTELEMELR